MRDYTQLTDDELIDKLFEASELCPPDGTIRRTDLCHEAGKRLIDKQFRSKLGRKGEMFNQHKTPNVHPHIPSLMLRSDFYHWPFVYAHGDLEEAFRLSLEAEGCSSPSDLICADVPVPEREGIHIGYHRALMVNIFIAKGASGELGGRVCYQYDRNAWNHCLSWYESQRLLQRKQNGEV